MIRSNEPMKFWWDCTILVLAIVICYLLPVQVAFEPELLESAWYFNLDLIINIIFGIDIIVNFITSYYDEDGNEVFEYDKIAINYVKKLTFYIDAISTIPFGVTFF